MLGEIEGKCLSNYVSSYVLLDLETTGISCWNDEIIEIAAVKVREGLIVGEFQVLVNPGRPIPAPASAVNHISDKMVENAEKIDTVLPKFLDFIGNDILVGHNIQSFDMKFIQRDCRKYYGQILENDYIDTLLISKAVFPNWPHRRLSDLADYYGFSTRGAHRALNDCRINQKIFERLALELDGTAETPEHKICLQCGKPMKIRYGKFGDFWGCSGYPKCRFAMSIDV